LIEIPEILIVNAAQIIKPLVDPPKDRKLDILKGAALAIKGGVIAALGDQGEILSRFQIGPSTQVIEATGKVVTPGFVDSHTHPIFCGNRVDEFEMRLRGKSYQEIAQAGGGIRSSVRGLREASKAELIEHALPRLDRFLTYGTTTLEAKSGYGLSIEDEIKSLEVIRELNGRHPIDLIPTFLGAHEIPDEYRSNRQRYIELVTREMIPRVVDEGLAEFCDVFCEEGVFSIEESRRILRAAKEAGLKLKIHADQLHPTGGAELAAELGAISADHLEWISERGIQRLAEVGVVATLLPGSVFFLGMDRYPPARSLLEAAVPVALATDFNPGSCMTESMPMILTLAAIQMRMSPEEVLWAATAGGAQAVDRKGELGTIAVGKKADLVIWDVPDYREIPYHFGVNLVHTVIKSGKIVYPRSR